MGKSPARADDLRNHGIAVNNGSCLSLKTWRDPETGRDYVYAGIISTPSLVVQVDVATGQCRDFRMPSACGGPWGIDFTPEGQLLVTSVSGHLCRLDPRTGDFRITATPGQWLWTIARGEDGKFYLGSSPQCRLFRYDAASEALEDLGRLDPEQQYLRILISGNDGYMYASIGVTAAQVVAYHIATGQTTVLLPPAEAKPDFLPLSRGSDGKIYVRCPTGNLYRLEQGQAVPLGQLSQEQLQAESPFWTTPLALPDGRPVRSLDPDAIGIGDGADAVILPLEYQTDGTGIFHLAEGPHHTVYASTIMPLYLLRYTPATDTLEKLGRGAPDNGEAYSFGHCDGKLYYGCYHLGNLMCYDPARPWHTDPPGAMQWKDNPVLIGHLGKGHCRPRAMHIDTQKRVWVGGFPEYGLFHGGLTCYDTLGKTLTNYPVVIPNQSIIALTADASGDVIYGGTSIVRGSGTVSATKDAHLFAWDAQREQVLWQFPLPGVTGILNLRWHDGKLYGSTGSNFSIFRFDPHTRTMDYYRRLRISAIREQSMCLGPDGHIYGITWIALFRWRLETGDIEVLSRCVGERAKSYPGGSLFHRGAVIIDDRFYFSCGPQVMSMHIPLEKR